LDAAATALDCRRLLGAANEPKEGDTIVGVAAKDATERHEAREILLDTRLGTIDQHPPHSDELLTFINGALDRVQQQQLSQWTFAELKAALLSRPEADLHQLRRGLSSDVIPLSCD